MTYVDDAFAKCKTTLEITGTEQAFAKRKHHEIRDFVRQNWDLDDDFLTGSYRRQTKTKKLKDVDILIEIRPDGEQGKLRDLTPLMILTELQRVLGGKYTGVTRHGFGCTVSFGAEDEIASFDVIPGYKRDDDAWDIPDADRARWIATDPKIHATLSTDKNAACGSRFVPFVKMIKGMNRHAGDPISPSFLLEVMAQEIVTAPFGSYQDEIRWFLATAADRIVEDWPDPAGIGPNVNETMKSYERQAAADTLRSWLRIAENAVRLEDAGRHRDAVEEWRELFGSRMPRP